MITELFLRGRLRHDLSDKERSALDSAVEGTVKFGPRSPIIERGERLDRSFYLVSGTVLRVIDDKRGARQIVGINVVGDFIDLHGYPMKRLDHDVCTLDRVELAEVPHGAITRLMEQMPHLGRALWFSTLLDGAMHREWIFRLGRLNAEGRIAHLLAELCERLRLVGQYSSGQFPIPLLQRDFAEASGISLVHANRSFRNLKERGLLSVVGDGQITILDEDGLRKLADFKPDYLYGEGELEVESLSD